MKTIAENTMDVHTCLVLPSKEEMLIGMDIVMDATQITMGMEYQTRTKAGRNIFLTIF